MATSCLCPSQSGWLRRATQQHCALARQTAPCCPSQPVRRRSACQASSKQSCQVTSMSDPLHPISGSQLAPSQCWRPTALFIAAAALLSWAILKAKEKKAAVREEPVTDSPLDGLPSDARHHQRVLAKARQATHIANAIAYNKSGEFTQAMLELKKALAENSICRTPALLTHSKDDMANLYRLHIRCTEQPPNFATLLQLQELLGLSQEEAEKIELELMTIPGAFAI